MHWTSTTLSDVQWQQYVVLSTRMRAIQACHLLHLFSLLLTIHRPVITTAVVGKSPSVSIVLVDTIPKRVSQLASSPGSPSFRAVIPCQAGQCHTRNYCVEGGRAWGRGYITVATAVNSVFWSPPWSYTCTCTYIVVTIRLYCTVLLYTDLHRT